MTLAPPWLPFIKASIPLPQSPQQPAVHKELLPQRPPGSWEVLRGSLSASARGLCACVWGGGSVCVSVCVSSQVTFLTWNGYSRLLSEQRAGMEGDDDLGPLV